jgi:hypothetical protein
MEQQLINAFMKLMSKAGAGSLIKDLIQQVDENGNPKTWTDSEINKALDYVSWQTENFGAPEAEVIIETLIRKYNLQPDRFLPKEEIQTGSPRVQGLQ